MKQVVFIFIYGALTACVGFTFMILFDLPSMIIIPISILGMSLADRVGKGFGVQVFRRSDTEIVPS